MSTAAGTFNGSVPQNYDDYLGPFLFEPYALDLLKRIDTSLVTNALELACGTGRVTKHLLEHLPLSAQLIATDLNADMIEVASRKIVAPNVTWATVDLSSIPYEDGQFDLIVCQYGLMFVPDKGKALTEIYRVLKKGGKFIFNTWGNLIDNTVWNITNTAISSFIGTSPITIEQGPFSMSNKSELTQLLKQAGFVQAKVDSVKITGEIETAARASKGFIQGLPIALVISQKNPALIPKIQEALEVEFSKQLGDHPMKSPLHALVFDATK